MAQIHDMCNYTPPHKKNWSPACKLLFFYGKKIKSKEIDYLYSENEKAPPDLVGSSLEN